MKKLNKIWILSVIILVFLLGGCSVKGEPTKNSEVSTNIEEIQGDTIIDREGNEFKIPENVERIISMAPSITETLLDFGLADKLVAVDKYSVNLDGVNKDLPLYNIMSPDIEALAELQPDIIFATGMSKSKGDDPFAPLLDLGVTMTYIPTSENLESIKEDIRFIGHATKTSINLVEDIILNFESQVNDIVSRITDDTEVKKVYFETAAPPKIYTFGQNTFLNEMLTILKGENIFSDLDGWVSISEEEVINRNPDVILTNIDYIDNPTEELMFRPGWDAINAVKDKKVYQIDKDSSARANENVIKAFKEMAKAIHPELYSDY